MKAKTRSVKDQKPNAWVVNPKDRGRKSIKKDSKVYLEDGQNFEIELFNPLQDAVLAEIKVNGKPVSSSGLILRPGERFYLDCFVDDKKKFVFRTYDIEDTEESKEATSKNGLVEVFFYKEETLQLNNWRERFVPVIERRYYPVYYPWYPNPWNTYWYSNTTGGLSTYTTTTTTLSNLQNLQSGLNQNLNNGIAGTYTVNSSTLGGGGTISLNSLNTSNAYYSCNISDTSNQPIQTNFTSTIETGRIEKGEASDQQFEEVDMQFERYHISDVVYQLLPESQRPVETKELVTAEKKFCEECGEKLKGTEKFCSQCGTKV